MEKIQKLKKIDLSKSNIERLPEVPGCYIYFSDNYPIYIGKAINLKNRIKSYFTLHLEAKSKRMISEAQYLSYIQVFSEIEALLLESELIRKYKPKYNILSKDDKHAIFIVITHDKYPRILLARKENLYKVKHIYGPFPDTSNVKLILKYIRRIFPYSDHKVSKKIPPKGCFYSHLGLCNPCPNTISNKEDELVYNRNIKNINLVLSRKFNLVRNDLIKNMNYFSKNNDFEKAKIFRDKLNALDYITQKYFKEKDYLKNPNLNEDIIDREITELINILHNSGLTIKKLKRIECFDISHISGLSVTASMVTFINGKAEKGEYRHFKINQNKGKSDYDSLKEVAKRRFKQSWDKPDLIIVDGGLGQVNVFKEVFKTRDIPIIGIAKNPDRLIIDNNIKIRFSESYANLLTRIRDESHRFAKRYHHLLVKKDLLN